MGIFPQISTIPSKKSPTKAIFGVKMVIGRVELAFTSMVLVVLRVCVYVPLKNDVQPLLILVPV